MKRFILFGRDVDADLDDLRWELGAREAEIASLKAASLKAEKPAAVVKVPRGVVVTRMAFSDQGAPVAALDEYPNGDSWGVRWTSDGKDGTLFVLDVTGTLFIATYKPGTWDRIESGLAEDIKVKAEEPNKP